MHHGGHENLLSQGLSKGPNAKRTIVPQDPCSCQAIVFIDAKRNTSDASYKPEILALVGGLVVAGGAAGLAVKQAIIAQADVRDGLAEAAEFFALARSFNLFALSAFVARGAGAGTHGFRLARVVREGNVTSVIKEKIADR
jgi:hypothetical protein